jgi:hypothetical protein
MNKQPKVSRITGAESDYFALLEEDKLFKILILTYREKFGIPVNGLNFLDSKVTEILDSKGNEILNFSFNLCRLYALPKDWQSVFGYYTLFNRPLKINHNYEPITLFNRDRKLVIEINEKISIKKLFGLLKERKAVFKKEIEKLPKRPQKEIKNLSVRKEISNSRQLLKSKKYREIANELTDKYENKKISFSIEDELVLREYVSRNEKLLNKQVDKNKIDRLSLVLGLQDISEIIK